MQTYLNINVFSLPRNLILSEDRPQIENPCSEEKMRDIDRQLKEGKDKLMAVSLRAVSHIHRIRTKTEPKP